MNLNIDPNKFLPTDAINNLLGPSSKALGHSLGALFYFIFQKPIKYGIIKEKEFDDLASKTSTQLKQIPPENKDSSKSGLIMKAMEEAQYQLNEEDLRQMFANLIASSANNQKNGFITPRFATVLSQLGADNARFFKLIVKDSHYLLTYGYLIEYIENKYGPYHNLTDKFFLTNKGEFMRLPQESVDVLSSLGLIKDTDLVYPEGEDVNSTYNKIESTLKKYANSKNKELLEFKKGSISVTAFGALFAKAVLN